MSISPISHMAIFVYILCNNLQKEFQAEIDQYDHSYQVQLDGCIIFYSERENITIFLNSDNY